MRLTIAQSIPTPLRRRTEAALLRAVASDLLRRLPVAGLVPPAVPLVIPYINQAAERSVATRVSP